MRVLHVITTINRGGAENHLVELVSGQVAAGTEVAVAYLKGDGYWTEQLLSLGCVVFPLHLSRYGEIKPLMRLGRFIRDFQPEILHAHMPPAELYAQLAMLVYGFNGRFIISKHNDERFFDAWGQRVVGGWVLRRAKRVIAISDAVRRYVEANLRPRANQVVTVHYGIDSAPYREKSLAVVREVRESWGISDETYVIGTVARLVPQKALHVLLTAYATYRKGATCGSSLVLVGRGPLEGELRQLALTLGIEKEIVWAGFREDIPAVMSAFDCFALTSKYEGFGLVLLEAMAAGRPVVATAVSAIPEVVADGQSGILCPVDDVNSVASAFSRLADPSYRRKLGEAGARRAGNDFSLNSMVAKTLLIYQEAL